MVSLITKWGKANLNKKGCKWIIVDEEKASITAKSIGLTLEDLL